MKLNQSNRVATPFGDFQIDMENIVDQLFGDRIKGTRCNSNDWSPRVSISESDTTYEVVVELAGVDPADVTVAMEEGRLEISGEKKVSELEEGFTSLKQERRRGSFKRVFEFSKQLEPDSIKADFKNGILSIVLPKSEKVLPRKIEIDVSN